MDGVQIIAQGNVKIKDGRKWKYRWAVVTKLSPVADCLHLDLYGDSKDYYKSGIKKASFSLENCLAIESGFSLDKENNTLAFVCHDKVIVLAFDSREMLSCWQTKISNHFNQKQFLIQIVQVPYKSKVQPGPARLHLQEKCFAIVTSIPPKLSGFWPLDQLRRFGAINEKFCFEGGSFCGKGEGLFILQSQQIDELAEYFKLYSEKLRMSRQCSLIKRHTSSISSLASLSSKCSSLRLKNEKQIYKTIRSIAYSESDTCSTCSDLLKLDGDSSDTLSLRSKSSISQSLISNSSYARISNLYNSVNSLTKDALNNSGDLIDKARSIDNYDQNINYCVHCGHTFTASGTKSNCDHSFISPSSRTVSSSTISTLASDHSQLTNHDHSSLCSFDYTHSNLCNTKRSDQTRLYSSSSGSSSNSGSAYQSQIEYYANKLIQPSSCKSELYDKPKNIKHETVSYFQTQMPQYHSTFCACHPESSSRMKKSSTVNALEFSKAITTSPASRCAQPKDIYNSVDNYGSVKPEYYKLAKTAANYAEQNHIDKAMLNSSLYDVPRNFQQTNLNSTSMSQEHLAKPLNSIGCDEFSNQCNYLSSNQSQVTNVKCKSSSFNQTASLRRSRSSRYNYINLENSPNQNENIDQNCFSNYANLNYLQSLPIYAKVDKKRRSSVDTNLMLCKQTSEVIQVPIGQFGDDKINLKSEQSNDVKIKKEDELIDLETEIVFNPKHDIELPQQADLLSNPVSLVSLDQTHFIQPCSAASSQQLNLLSGDIISTPISTLISIDHFNDFINCDQISTKNVIQENAKNVNIFNCSLIDDAGKLKLASSEVDNLIEKDVQNLLEQLIEKVVQSVDVDDDQSGSRTESSAFSEINDLFQTLSFKLEEDNVTLQSKG